MVNIIFLMAIKQTELSKQIINLQNQLINMQTNVIKIAIRPKHHSRVYPLGSYIGPND